MFHGSIATFGIQLSLLPMTSGGGIKTTCHRQWINMIKCIDNTVIHHEEERYRQLLLHNRTNESSSTSVLEAAYQATTSRSSSFSHIAHKLSANMKGVGGGAIVAEDDAVPIAAAASLSPRSSPSLPSITTTTKQPANTVMPMTYWNTTDHNTDPSSVSSPVETSPTERLAFKSNEIKNNNNIDVIKPTVLTPRMVMDTMGIIECPYPRTDVLFSVGGKYSKQPANIDFLSIIEAHIRDFQTVNILQQQPSVSSRRQSSTGTETTIPSTAAVRMASTSTSPSKTTTTSAMYASTNTTDLNTPTTTNTGNQQNGRRRMHPTVIQSVLAYIPHCRFLSQVKEGWWIELPIDSKELDNKIRYAISNHERRMKHHTPTTATTNPAWWSQEQQQQPMSISNSSSSTTDMLMNMNMNMMKLKDNRKRKGGGERLGRKRGRSLSGSSSSSGGGGGSRKVDNDNGSDDDDEEEEDIYFPPSFR
jgi:hypothetical protein